MQEDHTDDDYELFLDMIQRMLTYEPAERITPLAALSHPFLQGGRLHGRRTCHPVTSAVYPRINSGIRQY